MLGYSFFAKKGITALSLDFINRYQKEVRVNFKKKFVYKKILTSVFIFIGFSLFSDKSFSAEKSVLLRYLYSIDRFYNKKLGLPTGVFVDKKRNEIYIADNQNNEILILDADGTPIFKVNKKKGIKNPLDLAVSNGMLYVVQEGKNYIEVFDFRGDFVRRISPPKNFPFIPGRLAIDEKEKLYVINKAKTNCSVFNKNGELIGEIGNGFFSLASITVTNIRIYFVTPFDSSAIQVFDKSGNLIMKYEALAGDIGTKLGIPSSGIIDNRGYFWLVDGVMGVITYDNKGREVTRSSKYGLGEIEVFYPIDIDFNGNDMIFIVNKMSKSIDVFKIDY